MATTDARTGFRLPWSSDQRQTNDGADESRAAPEADESTATAEPVVTDSSAVEGESVSMSVAYEEPTGHAAATPARKPSKFLAELTKAMQAAAEAAREETLTRFQAEAKGHVEQIHARSSEEAGELRKTADDDVAAIRDWSKAEIARVREETEQKITDRKGRLEREIEEHAALIEREIERVQSHVSAFESEMTAFFERLFAEDDPTRFAAMAENLPEPPDFDGVPSNWLDTVRAAVDAAPSAVVADSGTDESVEASTEAASTDVPDVVATDPPAASEADGTVEAVVEVSHDAWPAVDTAGADPWAGMNWNTGTDGAAGGDAPGATAESDQESAFAAIQAAAEEADARETDGEADAVAATDETPGDAATSESFSGEGEAVDAVDAPHDGDSPVTDGTDDPRLSALGLAPDFAAAAEAEAMADVDASSDVEIPAIADDALAARLAHLVSDTEGSTDAAEPQHSRVVVVGLVSVASIAGFKRTLARLPGVTSVGVSSGPDGEFVFAVAHDPALVLSEQIPTMPGFQARVTGTSDGVVNVTARDPEADA